MSEAADYGEPFAASSGEADSAESVALILVESLIHGLIARGSLSVVKALEIGRTALEVHDGLQLGDNRSKAAFSGRTRLLAIFVSLSLDTGKC